MVQGPNDFEALKAALPAAANPAANADAGRRGKAVVPQQLTQAADTVQLSLSAVKAAADALAAKVQTANVDAGKAQAAKVHSGKALATVSETAAIQTALVQTAHVETAHAEVAAETPTLGPALTALAHVPAPAVPLAAGLPPALPGSGLPQNTTPVQALASASAATPAKTVLQAEPEVRPTRVQEAQQNLASLTGDSGAMNARLAEKLLIEF